MVELAISKWGIRFYPYIICVRAMNPILQLFTWDFEGYSPYQLS